MRRIFNLLTLLFEAFSLGTQFAVLDSRFWSYIPANRGYKCEILTTTILGIIHRPLKSTVKLFHQHDKT
jgi:hypothetical protein